MQNTEITEFVIADTHFGHDLLADLKLRPRDVDRKVFRQLETLPDGCHLYHLGDFCIGDNEKWEGIFFEILNRKNISAFLVKGNHDRKKDAHYYRMGWKFVACQILIRKYGHSILMTHKPCVVGEHTINLHGHLHSPDNTCYPPAGPKPVAFLDTRGRWNTADNRCRLVVADPVPKPIKLEKAINVKN